MTKTALEQKRKTNHRARSHGGPDPEADLGASEAMQSAVRPPDSSNGPSRTSGESFLAHPAQALWAASGMLAIVVLIAILVPAGPLGLDRGWSEAMHHVETPLLTDLALVFNWVGRGVGRALTLTLVGLLLLRRRRWLALVALAVAESLAPLLSTLLKVLVDRSRPPDELVHPFGASFPSGHATYAGATCVALVLLFTTPGTHRRWWWALASLGVIGTAWSRTYLQVHWLTDVTAGALLGSSISLLVFAIAQKHVGAANGAKCGSRDARMTLGPCVSVLDTTTAVTGLRLAGSSHPEEAARRRQSTSRTRSCTTSNRSVRPYVLHCPTGGSDESSQADDSDRHADRS